MPVYHAALAAAAGFREPVAVVNIGGVANITFIAPGAELIACDAGPGNALIDDLMLARTGAALDRDGAAAAAGTADEFGGRRAYVLPLFRVPPPKSLDRNAFSAAATAQLSTEDAAATLTAFTAAGLARAIAQMPREPAVAIICGGGARNRTLMCELSRRLPCRVKDAAAFGWSVDAMEAQAFAYLAVRRLKNLPITFPMTTGVRGASTRRDHRRGARRNDRRHGNDVIARSDLGPSEPVTRGNRNAPSADPPERAHPRAARPLQ